MILDRANEGSGRVQAVSKKEESNEVDECLWKMSDLFESKPDLLPADREVVASFGKFRARAGLLVEKPPNSKDDPVCLIQRVIISGKGILT